MNWLQGDKFQKLATFTFAPKELSRHDYAQIPNNFDLNKLKDGDIIYCVSFKYYIDQLLELIKDTKHVTIITHNCDDGVQNDNVPENILTWYGCNVRVIHPKIKSIPTGLENDKWFPHLKKKEKMLAKMKEKKTLLNLVYMDHRIYSNPIDRQQAYDVLGKKSFVDAVTEDKVVNFDRYLHYVYNHKFIISPEGNGVQTHRPWEALYMGSIPIEKRNINNTFYEDLPICIVDDWEEVTESFLADWLIKHHNTKWNMDKLDFKYWENVILGLDTR
jgi:hypothetical protein